MMMAFIDAHREDLGIEPICRELAIAPSSYHEHALRLADPGKRPARARSDEEMREQIKRVHEANYGVYGSRKVWHQLRREGVAVAKLHGGAIDARHGPDRRSPRKEDDHDRQQSQGTLSARQGQPGVSRRPAQRLVGGRFTYVHTWAGFVYVAFVIDAYARRIVGWKVSNSATAGFVLDAL